MSGVFISYRRNDSSWFARSLFDALRTAFPSHAIFIDVEGIDAGLDFVDVINERLSSCEVLLTIIGKRWLEETAPNGTRRIDDPNDNVRAEIEAALQRKIRVIPVLVDGAQIPAQDDLPESLTSLSRRNGLEITHARFSSDTTRLVDVLSSVLSSEPRETAQPRGAVRPLRANTSHDAAETRQAADRDVRPWRWIVAGSAALIPVAALSAVLVTRAWPSHAPPETPPETVASTSFKTAPASQTDPSVPTGRSSAVTPEASVPWFPPNTIGPEAPAAPPAVVAINEPETTRPASETLGPESTTFKGLPRLDVVDKVDLDTDRASARLRIEANKLVARRAECESLMVHAEFGSFSMIGSSMERLPPDKGDGCFLKTSWKDNQSGTITDNMTEMRPKVLNQTLHLLCPMTYKDMVRDCKAY